MRNCFKWAVTAQIVVPLLLMMTGDKFLVHVAIAYYALPGLVGAATDHSTFSEYTDLFVLLAATFQILMVSYLVCKFRLVDELLLWLKKRWPDQIEIINNRLKYVFKTIKIVSISATFIIVLSLIGWIIHIDSKAKNYEIAYWSKIDAQYPYYRIHLKGTRFLMVHDPISALLGKTYVDTIDFYVFKITGTVNGNTISIDSSYKLLGDIKFYNVFHSKKKKMVINLYYDDTDANIKRPLSWNGEYTLVSNKGVP